MSDLAPPPQQTSNSRCRSYCLHEITSPTAGSTEINSDVNVNIYVDDHDNIFGLFRDITAAYNVFVTVDKNDESYTLYNGNPAASTELRRFRLTDEFLKKNVIQTYGGKADVNRIAGLKRHAGIQPSSKSRFNYLFDKHP